MKFILQVNGREMTFSEQELIAIVEEHLSSKTTKQVTTAVAQGPTEGEWFEVKPQAINQKIFRKKREDEMQEETRQVIVEAFAEMSKNPKKYGKNFKTMMPEKDWEYKTVAELGELACELGDHNASWVEQALEWAQRIANGESWETICNDADTADWYRLVVWKYKQARIVGGSFYNHQGDPASSVSRCYYFERENRFILDDTVPLVVLYEK